MKSDKMMKVLYQLLKNSKKSDRDLAKVLKSSQPTITRMRKKLERSGMVRDYTVIPDFRKMGFEILALTFVKMRSKILTPKVMVGAKRYAARFPNAIFASSGEGLGMTGVIISLHKNYTDYHRNLNKMRVDWKEFTDDIKSFVISIGEGEFKRFSLTYLGDVAK